jgi:5-methyltetrahydrofolate--homocysteine methyltransferase
MEKLREMIINGTNKGIADQVTRLLDQGMDAGSILNKVLIPAMDEVGDLFQKGEYFLPELLVSARAMQNALDVLKPGLAQQGIKGAGKAVVGTVKGDLHDIGKNLLVMSLEGAGFEVIDLGTDVSAEQFVGAVKEHKPIVMGMSALLSTTMYTMKDVVEAIDKAGLHSGVKIMVGGAPLNDDYAKKIGADFYGPDCIAGRDYARSVSERVQ